MFLCQAMQIVAALGLGAGVDSQQAPVQAQQHGHHEAMPATMTGALGSYPMTRDASGTAWQPDSTPHAMQHAMHGDWMISGHAMLNAVHDHQQGPRGDQREFVAGMIMGAARRDFDGGDALTLRAMLSPDPFMGRTGYPLLLAAGETADGETPLVDRQHPHELVMELSATWATPVGQDTSAFLYAALPGEPAFGPPAFMHRSAAMASPEAPITHHWLDSTHITFGVITAGIVQQRWKFEASRFTGREPDEDRFDIERPRLDSTALRASWNPGERWSLQLSWADLESPEQLEPEVDEKRLSASATYTAPIDEERWWSATIAWGRKDPREHESTNALVLEAAYAPIRDWLLFARAEAVETHDLGPTEEIFDVGKLSFGALREFRVTDKVRLGLGALYSVNTVADELEPSYGGSPDGTMIFLQLVAGT
jgi:hypothetical protein